MSNTAPAKYANKRTVYRALDTRLIEPIRRKKKPPREINFPILPTIKNPILLEENSPIHEIIKRTRETMKKIPA